MTTKESRYQARIARENRARGLVRRSLWAHPDDWPDLKRFADDLTAEREEAAVMRRDPNLVGPGDEDPDWPTEWMQEE